MNHNEQLDNILDDALAEYREAEPLAGIEDRVLLRLRLHADERRTAWWKWSAVAACVAMLAFAAWLGLRGQALQVPTARQQTQASNGIVPPEAKPAAETPRKLTSEPAPMPPTNIPARVARTVNTLAQVAQLDNSGHESPQLPTPLTGEERQLLALAQAHPDALQSISQEDRPISIAPLNIQPLPSEANPNGDN